AEGEVEDGTEVEIEAEEFQDPAGEASVPFDQRVFVLLAELLRAGRFAADEAEPGDAPALLVDGDEGFDLAEIAEIVDELPQLPGGLDVASEEDEPARLQLLEAAGGVGIEFGAGNAGEEELAER